MVSVFLNVMRLKHTFLKRNVINCLLPLSQWLQALPSVLLFRTERTGARQIKLGQNLKRHHYSLYEHLELYKIIGLEVLVSEKILGLSGSEKKTEKVADSRHHFTEKKLF